MEDLSKVRAGEADCVTYKYSCKVTYERRKRRPRCILFYERGDEDDGGSLAGREVDNVNLPASINYFTRKEDTRFQENFQRIQPSHPWRMRLGHKCLKWCGMTCTVNVS